MHSPSLSLSLTHTQDGASRLKAAHTNCTNLEESIQSRDLLLLQTRQDLQQSVNYIHELQTMLAIVREWVLVCVFAHVSACVRFCACAYVCVCSCVYVYLLCAFSPSPFPYLSVSFSLGHIIRHAPSNFFILFFSCMLLGDKTTESRACNHSWWARPCAGTW